MTLIELIFTIVIIAFVFSVLPRIIYLSNKSLEFSKKEDAIFNMMAKIMDISLKEFDENNTKYDDILIVNEPPKNILDCNASSGYRVGGFKGSRSCENNISVSNIGPDNDEPPFDDVDDYDGNVTETTKSGKTQYTLTITVKYTTEWSDYDDAKLIFKFDKNSSDDFSNIKRIRIVVSRKDKNISSVSYYSANIGHIKIKSILWK